MRASAFTCSSRNECRRFRTLCVLLHRTPTDSRATRVLFTSPGGDFTRPASCYIARRRFRTPCVLYIARRRFRVLRVCFLHRTAVISHTAHAFTSHGGDFVRHALFYIARRRFRVLRVCFLHRPAVISHAMRPFISPADGFARHASFTSPADGFACYACAFYIERR